MDCTKRNFNLLEETVKSFIRKENESRSCFVKTFAVLDWSFEKREVGQFNFDVVLVRL